MIRLKQGVKAGDLSPQILLAIRVAEAVYKDHGIDDIIITSLNDSKHSLTSLHYIGHAVDLRTHHVPTESLHKIVQDLHANLGKHFDVVLEADHIHIEYQPRGES